MITLHKTEEYTTIKNKRILAEKGITAKDSITGITLYSSSSGKFIVGKLIGKVEGKGHSLYELTFIETGEKYQTDRSTIVRGKIKDYLHPIICDVAYLGRDYVELRENDPELFKVMKSRFNEMINRCYNPDDISYCRYGAIGVRVDKRWHNFCNFYRDIVEMNNFDRELFINTKLTLDKDYKQQDIPKGQRVYGKDTVVLLSYIDNHQFREREEAINAQRKYFISISPTGEEILWLGVNAFVKAMGFPRSSVQYALNGYKDHVHGYKLRYPTESEMYMIDKGFVSPGDKMN